MISKKQFRQYQTIVSKIYKCVFIQEDIHVIN